MKKLAIALILTLSLVARSQQPNPAGGTLSAASSDCSVAGSCVVMPDILVDQTSIVVTAYSAFVADDRFEGSYDGGLSWIPVTGIPLGGTTSFAQRPTSGAVAPGAWTISSVGLSAFRIRCNQIVRGFGRITLRALPAK